MTIGNRLRLRGTETLHEGWSRLTRMIGDGRIQDGKAIMLLQYAAINLFSGPAHADQVV